MNKPSVMGVTFGTTSGIITTLGLIVGLSSSDAPKSSLIAAVLTAAFIDAFSDAMGMEASEEAEKAESKAVWASSLSTYLSKLLIALSFLLPVIYFSSPTALIISIIWGMYLLAMVSYVIPPKGKKWQSVLKHLLIGTAVIFVGFIIGRYIRNAFGLE